MRARAGVLLALILAVVAAGCGGDEDRDAYVKALNNAQTGLAQRFTALQSRITPTSNAAQDIKTLRAYEAAVGTTGSATCAASIRRMASRRCTGASSTRSPPTAARCARRAPSWTATTRGRSSRPRVGCAAR